MRHKILYWEDIKAREKLTTLTREITTTAVVAAAIASRDFYPVHHDLRFAQKAGARDIFINILTSGGFVSRYLTDWSFHLGVPCYAGDTLTMIGKVVRKHVDGDQHLVDIEYNFIVPGGSHCSGTATMILPARGS